MDQTDGSARLQGIRPSVREPQHSDVHGPGDWVDHSPALKRVASLVRDVRQRGGVRRGRRFAFEPHSIARAQCHLHGPVLLSAHRPQHSRNISPRQCRRRRARACSGVSESAGPSLPRPPALHQLHLGRTNQIVPEINLLTPRRANDASCAIGHSHGPRSSLHCPALGLANTIRTDDSRSGTMSSTPASFVARLERRYQ